MKRYKILMLFVLLISICSCEDKILNLESLNEPTDASFYTNEQELNMALTGVYNSIIWKGAYLTPMQHLIDNSATDIGICRGDGDAFNDLGSGIQSSMTAGLLTTYVGYYKGIALANSLLQNMVKAKSVTPEVSYNQIKAQALVIRAYHYMYLTELFGDVPYLETGISTPAEGLVPRTPKSQIVDKMLVDLQNAADDLPYKWPSTQNGRITKGVALALRARIALYNGKFSEAVASSGAIINNETTFGYTLNASYKDLFQTAGQNSSEIMFVMPYMFGFATSQFSVVQGSRNLGSVSIAVPTQSMIDSYEAIDGKTIDKSAIYDPQRPFENRDPRLKASIITPQSLWAGIIFESHPDSLKFRLANGKIGGDNKDCRKVSWPGAFCGYLWKKYTIEENQVKIQSWDDISFILMRYAEVLLIYAEAKIEMGQIDASVLTSINRIRARAYGVSVTNTSAYPAITATSQAELRKVIRRERKVELANEGFRLFDIRRWKIAEKVMPVVVYGRILDPKKATKVPTIDDDCFVSYAGVESQYDRNTDSRFPNAQNRTFNKLRDYLLPIPQQEIDTYKGLGKTLDQNPGY
jgi:hypothetical protein